MSSCEIERFSPFVVFGASKSGTTWLQKILDLHPEVRCHFQLPVFPIYDRSLWVKEILVYNEARSPFKDVFPSEIDEKIYFAKLRYIRGLNFLNKKYPEDVVKYSEDSVVLDEIRKIHKEILKTITVNLICDDPSKKIFGTKSYTDLGTLFWVFPDAKLIHIVRDGRDVVVSKRFHNFRVGEFYLGDEKSLILRMFNRFKPTRAIVYRLRGKFGIFGRKWFVDEETRPLFHERILRKLATEWKNVVSYIIDYEEKYPGNILRVKYEDLKFDTINTMEKIFNFLGADSSRSLLLKISDETRFEKLKKSDGSSFYRKGKSGDWKNYFTEKDKKIFKQIAGDLLVKLGYEKDYDW